MQGIGKGGRGDIVRFDKRFCSSGLEYDMRPGCSHFHIVFCLNIIYSSSPHHSSCNFNTCYLLCGQYFQILKTLHFVFAAKEKKK